MALPHRYRHACTRIASLLTLGARVMHHANTYLSVPTLPSWPFAHTHALDENPKRFPGDGMQAAAFPNMNPVATRSVYRLSWHHGENLTPTRHEHRSRTGILGVPACPPATARWPRHSSRKRSSTTSTVHSQRHCAGAATSPCCFTLATSRKAQARRHSPT